MRKQWNSKQRFSLRKFSTGLASVLLATMFMSQGVMAQTQSETEGNVATESVKPKAEKESPARGKDAVVTEKEVAPLSGVGNVVNKKETTNNGLLEEKTPEVPIEKSENKLNKKNLEELLKQIDQLNLKDYTEATVKVLQEKVVKAREVLVNATTQKDIDSTYNALVGYKNSGLKRVPKLEENNTPKPDTTNGKETVGIKAENTELNGTNIAGHNHSLNGTTRSEGSGFRAVPEGDAYFNLDSGTLETEVGSAPNAKFMVVWRKGQGYKPQLASDGTGIYLQYDRQIPDSTFVKRLFNTTGSINTVGSYDVTFELKDGTTGVLYAKKDFKVTVKPQAPRVTVENLENAAGTRSKVTATARNPQYSSGEQPGESSVDFYVNGVKKQTVTAVNGVAEWTPTEVFNVNDRITATNTARDKQFLPSRGTNINVPITATTSNMSSEVVIPAPTVPSVDLEALKTAAKADLATAATEEKAEIAGDKSLTTAKRAEKEKAVDDKKAEEEAKITAADNADKVEAAKTAGVTAIKGVHIVGSLDDLKAAAKADLATAATEEKAEIAGDKSLTTAKRAEKEKAVDDKKAEEEAKITAADNADKVEAAKTAGVTAIKGVHTVGSLDDLKAAAKADLATFLQGELEKGRSLIEKEKDALISAVNDNLQKENKKIDDAQNADEVEEAKLAGIKVIPSVISLNEAAIFEKREINSDKNPDLTDVIRNKELVKVDETLKAELAKIDAVTTIDTIKKSTKQGVKAIEAIHKSLSSNTHEAAILALPELDLQTALVAGTATVKQGQKLADADITNQLILPEDVKVLSVTKPSTDEAGNFVAAVELLLADGKTKEIVTVPVSIYSQTPSKVDDLSKAKEEAMAKVEKAVKDKLQEIEKQADLTDEEKIAAKFKVDQAKEQATKQISKASSLGTVELLGEESANNIAAFTPEHGKDMPEVKPSDVSELDEAQAKGIAAVLQAEVDKLELMKKDATLTASEFEEVKAEVVRIKKQAIADIRREKDVKSIETITNVAVEAILNARPRYNFSFDSDSNYSSTTNANHSQSVNEALLAKKSEAKMLIEKEAMKKKAEISQAELSESEKALLDARVDQEKAKAFQMIDQATTVEEVDHALMTGIEAIHSIAVASANGRMTDVTPEESEAAMVQANRQMLPQTGTGNEVAIFGAAASAILAGLGLIVPSKKKED